MKIVWHSEARASYLQISRYVKSKFGLKARREFVERVRKQEKLLKQSPNIGQIDPLFDDMPVAYRSVIINGLNKMVYYVEDNTLNIAAFWDTRADADEQARQLGQ